MTNAKHSDDFTPERTRNRRVFVTATMTDEDAERITASLPTTDEIRTGRYAWQQEVSPPETKEDDHGTTR